MELKDYRFKREYEAAIGRKLGAEAETQKKLSEKRSKEEEWKRKYQDAQGKVNEIIAQADGSFAKAKIEADAVLEEKLKTAKAVRIEAEAEAKALREKIASYEGRGGEMMVKLELAKKLKNKKLFVLPLSGGMNLNTTNVNSLLNTLGVIKANEVSKGQSVISSSPPPAKKP